MTVKELKELLDNFDDETEVRLATQPRYPFENEIAGVSVDRETDVVYIVEGEQIGYASEDIWNNLI